MYLDENGLAEFTRKMKTYIDNKFAPTPQEEYFLTFSSPSSFTLKVVDNQKYWDGAIEYSTNKTTWNIWDGTTTLSSVNNGTSDNIYVRGIGNTVITGSSASDSVAKWMLTGSNISIKGNIENLLDYATVELGNHPAMASHCFRSLFRGLVNIGATFPVTYYDITDISGLVLGSETVTDYCYATMFYGNGGITTLPVDLIRAITLGQNSCRAMFAYCIELTRCCSLETITTLGQYGFYQMFWKCNKLETIPKLVITTYPMLSCAIMFSDCSKIKVSETQTGEYVNEYRIPYGTVTGVDQSYTAFSNMFISTGGTFTTGTPTINTTYYTSNEVV